MHNLIKRLEKRGWNKKDIDKAVGIIQKAKIEKTTEERFLEKRLYWVLLLLVIASNFGISVGLMPILMAINGPLLYFIIVVLGLVFGFLFELVIRSMEHLQRYHHLYLAFIIPLIALVNFFVISKISNYLELNLGLRNLHNEVMVSLVYAVSFVLPYLAYRFVLKIEYYARE